MTNTQIDEVVRSAEADSYSSASLTEQRRLAAEFKQAYEGYQNSGTGAALEAVREASKFIPVELQHRLMKELTEEREKARMDAEEKRRKIAEAKERKLEAKLLTREVPIPADIKAKLDEYVIGQEQAKRTLSVAAYTHYGRVKLNKNQSDGMEQHKSNVLLLGPTGCGKTLTCSKLAKVLGVPFAVADATELTPDGYVGGDVADILKKLWDKAEGLVDQVYGPKAYSEGTPERAKQTKELCEKGIVFIDEVDKLCSAGAQSAKNQRDRKNYAIGGSIKGLGVQQALLKMVEGTIKESQSQGQSNPFAAPQAALPDIDTKNILFIVGGAFSGLTRDGYDGHVTPDDIVDYGMMPEFVGRFPIITGLQALDKPTLCKILTEPKDALIKQYKQLFKAQGVTLYFHKEALEAMAAIAIERNTGARGLKGIIEGVITDLQFEIPSNWDIETVVITKSVIDGEARPAINPKCKISENWV